MTASLSFSLSSSSTYLWNSCLFSSLNLSASLSFFNCYTRLTSVAISLAPLITDDYLEMTDCVSIFGYCIVFFCCSCYYYYTRLSCASLYPTKALSRAYDNLMHLSFKFSTVDLSYSIKLSLSSNGLDPPLAVFRPCTTSEYSLFIYAPFCLDHLFNEIVTYLHLVRWWLLWSLTL